MGAGGCLKSSHTFSVSLYKFLHISSRCEVGPALLFLICVRRLLSSILLMQIQRALLRSSTSQSDFSLRMIDSSSSHPSLKSLNLLACSSFGFNSQRWYLREGWLAPSSAGPAWPVKSRHSRAALELNRLFEQLSLLGHADVLICETTWRFGNIKEKESLFYISKNNEDNLQRSSAA